MESEIAADLLLDCVEFHILPQDRYKAYICNNEKVEIVGDGPLNLLLEHLPNIKSQLTQGSCDNFKLELQGNLDDSSWFTKATLTRFLQLVGSSELLKKPLAISNEMSQLEERRKFHLSLYTQAEDGIKSSDNSKNELLRAMDLRLAALTEELVSTLNLATAGTTLTLQEMTDLRKFCQYFEDEDMRNMFSKLSEANKKNPVEKNNSPVQFISEDDYVMKTDGNIKASGPSDSNNPIICNVYPAKAAEIESRQNSSDTETEKNSSFSSDEEKDDQPSAERSRTFMRSATPRRSASPMRRIQIGRSGSRRTPALTVKSLAQFPVRERAMLEESEEPIKKTEVNVTRMSVQDAISLFERKQNDESGRTQKNSVNVKKSVLRRWSAGMGESRNILDKYIPEDNGNLVNNVGESSADCGSESVELETTVEIDVESEENEKNGLNRNEDDVALPRVEENDEKLDSTEWSRQKEAELNEMLTKFADSGNSRRKSSSLVERKGGDEKFRRENAVKRIVKQPETKLKPKPKIQENPKAEKSPLKVSDVAKRNTTTAKTQNVKNKSISPVASNSKKESPKPVIRKKATPKSSPLTDTRKSWQSRPSPGPTGSLPSKLPTITPPSRNTAPPVSVSKSTSKSERSNLRHKDVLEKVDDSKSRVAPKTTKRTADVAPGEIPDVSAAKPVVRIRKKVTKRSSVVPLEAKSEERKVSAVRPRSKPDSRKIEKSAQPEEILSECEKPVDDSQEQVEDLNVRDDHLDVEEEKEEEEKKEKPEGEGETKAFNESPVQNYEVSEIEPSEEQLISPAAWVESNEQESCSKSPANPDADVSGGTRVRHSLSQMLLEESGEPDVVEWGNTENPPTIIHQKDAPKGLKRLLKFGRKSKEESNASVLTTPCESDGEDDGDECKSLGKRNSDNLLKVALHSKTRGDGFFSDSEQVSARSNASNNAARNSRGSRSFFSLSAFRGNKN